jgi:hypothetical protein
MDSEVAERDGTLSAAGCEEREWESLFNHLVV